MTDTNARTLRFTPDTTVRDALHAHPATWDVFERHGLHGCGCSHDGPAESIRTSARMHYVDEQRLLRELREAAADVSQQTPQRDTYCRLHERPAAMAFDERHCRRIGAGHRDRVRINRIWKTVTEQ